MAITVQQQQQEVDPEVPLRTKEAERRRNQYYRSIFDKYDKNHDGFINLGELHMLIESREYEHDIPRHVVRQIHEMVDKNADEHIDFNEFVEMINHPDLQYVFGHYVSRYVHWVIPRRREPGLTVPDGVYDDLYSCYPPAVGMIIVSIVIVIVFCIDEMVQVDSTKSASGPLANLFIYDPHKRSQVWRYFTYMFVHVGVFHLFVNLLVQILLGTPLEMVHKWWRVLIIYICGVIAGSLGTSIVDSTVRLAGASGGVYALITAHIATIIMNWKEMSFPAIHLMIFVVITGSDVGTAIYNRYVQNVDEHIGYTAHFAGALAGLLVGLNVLKNLNETRTERVIWWVSMLSFTFLMAVAILWNLIWTSYFLKATE